MQQSVDAACGPTLKTFAQARSKSTRHDLPDAAEEGMRARTVPPLSQPDCRFLGSSKLSQCVSRCGKAPVLHQW